MNNALVWCVVVVRASRPQEGDPVYDHQPWTRLFPESRGANSLRFTPSGNRQRVTNLTHHLFIQMADKLLEA